MDPTSTHDRCAAAGANGSGIQDLVGDLRQAKYGDLLAQAAENALKGDRRHYDVGAMPSVVFTDLQAIKVGLTEAQARRQGYQMAARGFGKDLALFSCCAG